MANEIHKAAFTDLVRMDEHGAFSVDFFRLEPTEIGELVVGGINFFLCSGGGGENNSQCHNNECFNGGCSNGNCVFVGINPQCENVTCA